MVTVAHLVNVRLLEATTSSGQQLDPAEHGWVSIKDGHFSAVGRGPAPQLSGAEVIDCEGLLAAPGFVDQHCHGGDGSSFPEGTAAARIAAAAHLRWGTTTVVASLVSAAAEDLIRQVVDLAPLVHDDVVAGIHLEGPWINAHQRGAHAPATLREPDPAEIAALLTAGRGAIAMVTLAPELAGGLAAIRQLTKAGVVVAIGHTQADAATTRDAIEAGATVATHLFNAMPALHHRAPGVVGVLLRDPRVIVELIADGQHLDPDTLAVSCQAAGPGRVALISDAMAAAGCGDGRYLLGGLAVNVVDGVARLSDGDTLAGSTVTLLQALRHAVLVAGLPLATAVTAATATPARSLGLQDRGRIATGMRADLVLLESTLELRGVVRRGAWVRHLCSTDSATAHDPH
jgi:N-acetylglucosamine-6-phosphate deacetylase